uniref:MICAL-like 2 n=1 Tax=Nothobranchius rachovii TaxID=451742 RepID=A0A1A8NKN8_9TELE
MAAIKALEQWCKLQCEGYRDVAITNMTTSFRNGMAFCALIHKYRPDLIDYDSLRKEDVFENNRLAFQVAEDKLGIPALLDAEDMVALRIPDRLSILTYVSQYHNYFKGRPPMGGVKRPAEGSKEEPSEKKTHPVVSRFVTKTGIENCSSSSRSTRLPSSLDRPAAEKAVLTDNPNKGGTLNSKCVACKSHVHLVQRHFVEGKLYHRSCFKCSECSSFLHAGGYRSGKNPDTFVCSSHQSSSKTPPSSAEVTTGVPLSSSATLTQPVPHFSSVLSAPVDVVLKPASPTPQSQSWTVSAQRTQAARQKFFQALPQVTETSAGIQKPIELLEKPKVHLSSADENRTRLMIGKKLAEANGNNNNSKKPFTIRPAERRFCANPVSDDFPGLRKETCSQGPTGSWEGPTSSSQANDTKSQQQTTFNMNRTGPAAVHKLTKDTVYLEWQTKLRSMKTDQRLKDPELEVFTEHHMPSFTSTASCAVPISAARSAPVPTPALPGAGFAPFDPVCLREVDPQKPLPAPESCDFKHKSPVKSPLRPSVKSIHSTAALDDPASPAAAKKGKYLSPNTFRTEMRSPSVKSPIPAEQIEKELDDIEKNLARLEKEGVELEKKLRSCEEEEDGDILMDPLMVDWFNLIRQKQMYVRKESELVYVAKTQELEQQQPGVEGELRRLLEKPEHLKSREEQQQEKQLMRRLVEIVNGRNAIVEVLDEDRLREVEEDLQLNKMMRDLGVKQSKTKRKSSISKMFRRRSKRRVE